MVQITAAAAGHLHRVRAERGFDERTGARFVRGRVGVGLTFVRAPKNGDRVLTVSDLPVYIAGNLVGALERAVIDETSDEQGSRLVVRPAS